MVLSRSQSRFRYKTFQPGLKVTISVSSGIEAECRFWCPSTKLSLLVSRVSPRSQSRFQGFGFSFCLGLKGLTSAPISVSKVWPRSQSRTQWFSRGLVLIWYHCRSLDAELVSLLNEDLHEALLDNIQTADAETDYWIGLHRARWIWDASGKLSVSVLCGTLKKLRGPHKRWNMFDRCS